MKNFILFLTLSLTILSCSNDNAPAPMSCDYVDFKYYNGSQFNLGLMSNDYLLIAVDTSFTENEISTLIASYADFDPNYVYTIHSSPNYKFKEIPVKLSTSKTCEEITQIIHTINQDDNVAYTHFAMVIDNCTNLIWETIGSLCINTYGSSFFVKVFDENDLDNLNLLAAISNAEIVAQNQFMPKWFELRATKNSTADALALANMFYESGHFEHSEPSLSTYAVQQ